MAAAGLWKKLAVLTSLIVITTLLNFSNLISRTDNASLREVGPSKMSDKELYTGLPQDIDLRTISKGSKRDGISFDNRREIREKPIMRQTNLLSHSNRQLKESKTAEAMVVEGGYVLADDYWEQQNSGCRNLQSLQCWAAKLNMKVVEPFIVNSVVRTLPTLAKPSWLRYRDMFDVDGWNRESVRLNHSVVVPWEKFLTKAHRRVITVEFEYAYTKDVQRKQRELRANPTKRVEIECEPHTGWPKSSQVNFLSSHNFTIVKKVCLNFDYGQFLTLDEFRDAIFGGYSPGEVTVIFRQWRGLGIAGRILVKDSKCANTGIQENMQPSQRLLDDADRYTSLYLNGNFSKFDLPILDSVLSHDRAKSNSYTAVMARLEKSKLSFNKREGIVPYCLEQTLKYTRKVVAESGIGRTFLSIDIGKYGSNSFRNTGDSSNLHEEFEKFFANFYSRKVTISEWEQTFQDIAHTDDSGYIALLQKMIVVQAKCVIFVGGGAFQKHALNLYQSSHPKEEWCIRIIKECTTDKNLPMD